jgi:hypothetical protein
LRGERFNRQGVDAVIRNVFHQRRIDSLLFLHTTHPVKDLTHSNNLEVTAIARAFISTAWISLFSMGSISSDSENKPNILEQSGVVLNKQKAPTMKLSGLSEVTH